MKKTEPLHPGRELLSAFLDGDLGGKEQARVSQHLAQCPDCRRELEGLQKLRSSLTGLAVEPPESLWHQVRTALAENHVWQSTGRDRRWGFWGWTVALAATVAGLAWLAFVLLQPVDHDTPYEALMAVQKAEAEYQKAIDVLSSSLQERQDLNPEVKVALSENLLVIDQAIDEFQKLLRTQPQQLEVHQSMLALYQKKVDLLSKAVLEAP